MLFAEERERGDVFFATDSLQVSGRRILSLEARRDSGPVIPPRSVFRCYFSVVVMAPVLCPFILDQELNRGGLGPIKGAGGGPKQLDVVTCMGGVVGGGGVCRGDWRV